MHDDLGAKLTAFDLELKALSYHCANDEKPEPGIESAHCHATAVVFDLK